MPQTKRWDQGLGPGEAASRVYGFTTEAELSFLRWYLATEFKGAGAVVELGTALGRSTLAILEGLARNPLASKTRVHAYDLFEFDWYLLDTYGKQPGVDLAGTKIGDSFLEIFRSNLAPHAGKVDVRAGDLAKYPWTGGPIEFLFVDIMKSWETTRAVIETFFPALEPQTSLLVHQDYKHPFSPQILLTMYRLREYFEPAWSICGSGISASVAFRCVRKPRREEIDLAMERGLCDLASYSIGEIEAAIDHALEIVDGAPDIEVNLVKAARTVIYAELLSGRPDYARTAAEFELVRRHVQWHTALFLVDYVPAQPAIAQSPEEQRSAEERDRILAEQRQVLDEAYQLRQRLATIESSRLFRLARAVRRKARKILS